MKLLLSIALVISVQGLFGQSKPITYTNYLNAYYNDSIVKTNSFFEPKVNEITLNADSTFEFWSRPNISCFTWHQYKGRWLMAKDTILFSDNYEVVENDSRVIYKKDSRQEYRIHLSTDKKSMLKSREIQIQYVYDFDAHLTDVEKAFPLSVDDFIEIPFRDIPNHDKLAAIRIEYLLPTGLRRYTYLTENRILNRREGELPNVIGVEFVEEPKREVVYRTIKALMRNKSIVILSTTKNKTALPDYYTDIEFEDNYTLHQ